MADIAEVKFDNGVLLEEVTLANGAVLCLGEGLMSYGVAREMVISMQPSHGGMAPWICVIWDEEGCPVEYINMATVQKVIPK